MFIGIFVCTDPLLHFKGPKRKLENTVFTIKKFLQRVLEMGKYSSKESKDRHNEKSKTKRNVLGVLLDYSFHDPETFPEYGEVLMWPGGESPTLSQIS